MDLIISDLDRQFPGLAGAIVHSPQPQRGLVLTIVEVMLLGTTYRHWLGYV